MSKINLNKKLINEQFLSPLSRISAEASLKVNKDNLSALVNDESGSVILYSKIKANTGISDQQSYSLNIKDIRKLIKIFDCIPDDDFVLNVNDDSSVISFKSSALSFKLHLVSDNVIKSNPVSIEKISRLEFNSNFKLTRDKINDILKGSIFTSESNKIYFYTKDKTVFAELSDHATQNVDSVTFAVSDKYEGEDINNPLPFNLDTLRIISSSKFDELNVKINNTYNILLFEISTPESLFKYIVSGYKK